MEEAQPPKIISPYLIHWSQNEAWSRRRQQQRQQLRTPHVKVRVRAQHRCQTWRQGSSTQSEHAARTSRCLMSVAARRLAALFWQIYLSLCLRGIRSGKAARGGASSAAGVQGWHYFSPPTLHPEKEHFWRIIEGFVVGEDVWWRSAWCGAAALDACVSGETGSGERAWESDAHGLGIWFFLNKDRGKKTT